MKKNSMLRMLSDPLLEEIIESDISEDSVKELVEKLLSEGADDLLESLKLEAPAMLEVERNNTLDFEQRNYQRWKEPLNLLTMLWVSCQEISESHTQEGPQSGDIIVFDTLAHLQPKALLIVSEMLCLLKGGFADGALARWRSLHEVVVTSMFIAKHGHDAALGYRLSTHFSNYRNAKQYNEYASLSGMTPLKDQELADLKSARDTAETHLGRCLKKDWDWAAGALNKKEPSFFDLEKDVGMDHWRPKFKWACQHIHAGFVSPDKLLGMSEAEEFAFQVGPSNSGLVDPIHMAAISLTQITTTFMFFPEPNFDRLLFAGVLTALTEQIGDVALETQEWTLREARGQI